MFAGRIADAGGDPLPIMEEALRIMRPRPQQKLIWASPREVYNVVQADMIGCHIITVTRDLIAKLASLGRDLDEFSLDTVKMFRRDAVTAGCLPVSGPSFLLILSADRAGRPMRRGFPWFRDRRRRER